MPETASTSDQFGSCSRDPIGYVPGRNLYEYVGSNPSRATDPSGLWETLGGPAGEGPWPRTDWYEWWEENYGGGNIDVLGAGCIGVAGTVCGATDINDFIDSLECYNSEAATMKSQVEMWCNYCDGESPKFIAIQFNKYSYDKRPNGTIQPIDNTQLLDNLVEPFVLSDIWEIVNEGVTQNQDGTFNPYDGGFDVQITFDDIWLGADQGVGRDGTQPMNVLVWPSLDNAQRDSRSRGYRRDVYCVSCGRG